MLNQIQSEIADWSCRNFGAQRSKATGHILGSLAPLLGLVEEFGEHEDAMTPADLNDAEADMGIYLLDFLAREGVSVDELPPGDKDRRLSNCIRRLCHAVLKRHQGIRGFDDDAKYTEARNQAAADLIARLRRIGKFDATIAETWAKVKQRDWVKNRVCAAEVA